MFCEYAKVVTKGGSNGASRVTDVSKGRPESTLVEYPSTYDQYSVPLVLDTRIRSTRDVSNVLPSSAESGPS